MAFDAVQFPAEDLTARASERTLRQFRSAAVLQAVLAALVSEIQLVRDAAMQVQQLRTPAAATGANEEAVGRIVGMSRVTFDYGRLNWFTPDDAAYAPDISTAWVTGAPLGTLQQVGDETYRSLIEAKVFRNFTQYGSLPEIQQAIETAYRVKAAFQLQANPMDVYIILPRTTPTHVRSFLTTALSNNTADSIYFPPYPMTWRITGTLDLEDLVLTDDAGEVLIDSKTGRLLTIHV